MKLTFFTLLLICSVCVVSCKKSSSEPDIKQYDQQQIESYIAANGITGMQRDTTNGDTTGTYFKIITQGNGARLDYPDSISYVYTVKSLDGKYILADTVIDHYAGLVGYIGFSPPGTTGLMLAVRNNLKYKGSKMRVLVPSHLAFGKNGFGTGSVTLTSGRIAGNQSLDYTISVIDNQIAYDDLVIKNYMAANSLTGFTETADGLWYKITTVGTGASITDNSSVTVNYVGKLMSNYVFDDHSSATFPFSDLASGDTKQGFVEGLKLSKGGGAITIIMPSRLAYGNSAYNGIPANSCLRFDISNITVTNY